MTGLIKRDFFDIVDNFFGLDDIPKPSFSVPLINSKHIDGGMQYEIAAPGLEKSDFDIDVESNRLRISVQKKEEVEDDSDGWVRREYNFSTTSRSVPLPRGADISNITASYDSGILKVIVPTDSIPDRIKIDIE